MIIIVREDDTGWAPKAERFYAYDDDSYDGAEDSRTRNHVGRGPTELAAVAALLEILEDHNG